MAMKRKIEIFSAGCPACDTAISRIRDLACPSCEIAVLDMNDGDVAARAKAHRICPRRRHRRQAGGLLRRPRA